MGKPASCREMQGLLLSDASCCLPAGAPSPIARKQYNRFLYNIHGQAGKACQISPAYATNSHSCVLSAVFIFIVFLTVAVFSGHQNSTFYIKSSISPDDQFLVSGSSDCNAYIWKVRRLGGTQVCCPRLAAQICSALWFHLLFMFT